MNYGFFCYLFLLGIIGHGIGDFPLQPKSWAIAKSAPTWKGFEICTIHVAVYTICVMVFWQNLNPLVFATIAMPHWIIDRYSAADKLLKILKGRTFAAAYTSTDPYREFDIAFTSIVYTVTDALIHVACLWLTVFYFFS